MSPEVLIDGRNILMGGSGSCLSGPDMFVPVGHELRPYEQKWRNTFSYHVPGSTIEEWAGELRAVRLKNSSVSEADSMVEGTLPDSCGPDFLLTDPKDRAIVVADDVNGFTRGRSFTGIVGLGAIKGDRPFPS